MSKYCEALEEARQYVETHEDETSAYLKGLFSELADRTEILKNEVEIKVEAVETAAQELLKTVDEVAEYFANQKVKSLWKQEDEDNLQGTLGFLKILRGQAHSENEFQNIVTCEDWLEDVAKRFRVGGKNDI